MKGMRVVVLGFCLLMLAGCGGSGEPTGDVGYGGSYEAPFAEGNGVIAIGMNENRTVDVLINDGVDGVYASFGATTSGNSFSVVCEDADGREVTITGILAGPANARMVTGSMRGELNLSYVGSFVQSHYRALFANSYEGKFRGDAFGEVHGTVHANGRFEGTWDRVSVTGSVSRNGFLRASNESAGLSLRGALRLVGSRLVLIDGLWSLGDRKGRWHAESPRQLK